MNNNVDDVGQKQCDQIGQFLKFLTKVAQMYGDYLGYLEKRHFLSSKNCCSYSLAASGNFLF